MDIIEAVFVEEAHRGGARLRLAAATRTCLAAHLWPGNIRELRHAMRYIVALVDHGEVRPEHLPPFIAHQPAANGQVSAADAIERQRIAGALKRTAWNITAAARLLDISRSTLHRKIQQHALTRDER
jgi:transcriptional regulator of acetoin/glycerol metabolism